MITIDVDVDIDEFPIEDIVDYVENKGYSVSKNGFSLLTIFEQEELDWLEKHIVNNNLDDCNMVVQSILNRVRYK